MVVPPVLLTPCSEIIIRVHKEQNIRHREPTHELTPGEILYYSHALTPQNP